MTRDKGNALNGCKKRGLGFKFQPFVDSTTKGDEQGKRNGWVSGDQEKRENSTHQGEQASEVVVIGEIHRPRPNCPRTPRKQIERSAQGEGRHNFKKRTHSAGGGPFWPHYFSSELEFCRQQKPRDSVTRQFPRRKRSYAVRGLYRMWVVGIPGGPHQRDIHRKGAKGARRRLFADRENMLPTITKQKKGERGGKRIEITSKRKSSSYLGRKMDWPILTRSGKRDVFRGHGQLTRRKTKRIKRRSRGRFSDH